MARQGRSALLSVSLPESSPSRIQNLVVGRLGELRLKVLFQYFQPVIAQTVRKLFKFS